MRWFGETGSYYLFIVVGMFFGAIHFFFAIWHLASGGKEKFLAREGGFSRGVRKLFFRTDIKVRNTTIKFS